VKALAINDKVLKAGILALSFTPSFTHAITNCDATDENPVTAPDPISAGANCAQSKSNTNSLFGSTGIFHTIADTLIYLVGAVAVIMLIIGGLRYVISQGSKEGVASAKDTILYSVIGIVVAILAYAIVSFVTGSLTTPATSGGS
jgi:type IV secretion system pilin